MGREEGRGKWEGRYGFVSEMLANKTGIGELSGSNMLIQPIIFCFFKPLTCMFLTRTFLINPSI